MNKKTFWTIVVLIVLAGAVTSYVTYQRLSLRPVFSSMAVERGNINGSLSFSGKIVPKDTANLGFQVGGQIIKLNYQTGDKVQKGDELAQVDNSDLAYQYKQAEFGVFSAKEYLDQLEKTQKQAELKRKGMKNDATVKSTDKKIQDQQIKLSKEAIDAQEYQIKAAETNLENIQNQIDQTIIRAPFSGVISWQDSKVGEVASVGTPIITLISDNDFKIEAEVSQLDLEKISVGEIAKISFDALGSNQIEAKVNSIDPAEKTGNSVSEYKVTLEFDNKNLDLRSGMDVNIKASGDNKNNVLLIPVSAVFRENDKNYVYKDNSGKFEKTEVNLGIYGDHQMVEVISGLSQGENILVLANKF